MIIGNTKNLQEKCPAQCVHTNRDIEEDKNLLPEKIAVRKLITLREINNYVFRAGCEQYVLGNELRTC